MVYNYLLKYFFLAVQPNQLEKVKLHLKQLDNQDQETKLLV